jgi:glycosyltransferase involved in cell wall biosynthesis
MFRLLQFIYLLIRRVSPELASLISSWYHTINGWRFHDLKSFIVSHTSSTRSDNLQLSRLFTVQDLSGTTNSRRPEFAVISLLPPADTGVATCSWESFRGSERDVDIFTYPETDEDFFQHRREASASGRTAIYHIDFFFMANSIYDYRKIIIIFGNSSHYRYVWDFLNKVKKKELIEKLVAYIHDPVVHNVCMKGMDLSASAYARKTSALYSLNLHENKLSDNAADWEVSRLLLESHVFGLRHFTDCGISHFLVNSNSAASILKQDLDDESVRVDVLFHPVFLPPTSNRDAIETTLNRSNDVRYVGCFGVPDFSKGIDIVIDAVSEIRKKTDLNLQLVVAGYNAESFFSQHSYLRHEHIHIFDSPTDQKLIRLMNSVDLAVQLRLRALGESSGIVPQLLYLRKNVIVSPVGAFLEYGECVSFSSASSAPSLADDIYRNLIQDFKEREIAIERYISDRSTHRFRKILFDALNSSRVTSSTTRLIT